MVKTITIVLVLATGGGIAHGQSPLRDPSTTALVERVAGRFAERPVIRVIDWPGTRVDLKAEDGSIEIDGGFLASAGSEADLAEAIAHQLAHRAVMQKALQSRTPAQPVVITGQCARGRGASIPRIFRTAEEQAEAVTPAILRAAGYSNAVGNVVTTAEFVTVKDRLAARYERGRARVPSLVRARRPTVAEP